MTPAPALVAGQGGRAEGRGGGKNRTESQTSQVTVLETFQLLKEDDGGGGQQKITRQSQKASIQKQV